MKKLSHINARGEASMVDVSTKPAMHRVAIASGEMEIAAWEASSFSTAVRAGANTPGARLFSR